TNVPSNDCMRMGRQLVIVLMLAAVPALAQQQSRQVSAAATNSLTVREDPRLTPLVEDAKPARDVIVRKNVEFSGPLVRPFTVRRIADVPKRLLQLLNPFAPA